jgi:hypothetical protein
VTEYANGAVAEALRQVWTHVRTSLELSVYDRISGRTS